MVPVFIRAAVAPAVNAAVTRIAAILFLYLMFLHFSLLMNIMTIAIVPRAKTTAPRMICHIL